MSAIQTASQMPTRRVVCAAVRVPGTDLIFCGPRHFDKTMHVQIDAAGLNAQACVMEQGFVDQFGGFMDRAEAMRVARAAGQQVDYARQGGDMHLLYSEGLY